MCGHEGVIAGGGQGQPSEAIDAWAEPQISFRRNIDILRLGGHRVVGEGLVWWQSVLLRGSWEVLHSPQNGCEWRCVMHQSVVLSRNE